MAIGDVLFTVGYLMANGMSPSCPDAADTNDSGVIEVSDAILLLTYLFQDETAPPPPGPGICGVDPTPSVLSMDCLDSCP